MSIDDEGVVPRFMRTVFGRCWKTSLAGYITGAAILADRWPHIDLPTVLIVLGVVGLSRSAKDFDKTGLPPWVVQKNEEKKDADSDS